MSSLTIARHLIISSRATSRRVVAIQRPGGHEVSPIYNSIPTLICFESEVEFTPGQQAQLNSLLADDKRYEGSLLRRSNSCASREPQKCPVCRRQVTAVL